MQLYNLVINNAVFDLYTENVVHVVLLKRIPCSGAVLALITKLNYNAGT